MPSFCARLLLAAAILLTLLAAPAQALLVDPPGAYQPQVSCDPHAKPGVLATRQLILRKFGGGDSGIVRSCGVGGLSEHKEGRAWDWRLNYGNQQDRARAQRALTWLLATRDGEPAAQARRLGIMYIIWNKRIWGAYSIDQGWRPYTGASPHRDHVHISFTWNGATKRTAYWTGRVMPFDYGPCQRWVGELARPWRAPQLEPCTAPLYRPVERNGWYVAQQGETVARVARFFDRSQAQLRRWNNWPSTGWVELSIGDRIRVRR